MILTKTYLEPKHFYRKIETIFRNLEIKSSSTSLMRNLISKFFCEFCEPLRLLSAHLYERTADEIELVYTKGSFFSSIAADLLEKLGTGGDQKEVQEFPWVEPLRGRIIAVLPGSKGGQNLMAFIGEGSDPDEETKLHWNTVFSSFHYAMTQHFRRLELLDTLEQARAIQISLLPDSRTHFCDFDIYAESKPAELVGGDFFDIQQLEPKTLRRTRVACRASSPRRCHWSPHGIREIWTHHIINRKIESCDPWQRIGFTVYFTLFCRIARKWRPHLRECGPSGTASSR
jgi:hypothetical protein